MRTVLAQPPVVSAVDRPPRLRVYGLTGLVATATIVGGAIAGGKSFVSTIPGAWFFGAPGGPLGSMSQDGGHLSALAMFGVYGGLLVLGTTWWRLVRALDVHRGVAVARVVGVVALWALPLLLAPPLFSRDVFSYAGQGEMVSHHIDPYIYGTGVLGATRFNSLAGPFWANTPSPYGPLFLALDGLATAISGHQVLADLALLRLLAVAGVALAVAGIPTLARAAGRDPASAVVLGAGSPLVLATLVAGDHNDALMVGLLVAGLAAARRFGTVPGLVLCALAVAVKAPALLGVAFLGWNWAGPGAPPWRRVGRVLGAGAITGATLAVTSWVTGIGWGWVGTLTAEDKVHTGVTPVDAVAHVAALLADGLGVGWATTSVRSVFAVGALIVAAGVTVWLLWHSPRLGLVRSLGTSLLVVALLAPVLWGWYLTWGVVVLAPVVTGLPRRALGVFAVAEAMIGAASVIGVLRTLVDTPLVDDALLLVGLGAVAVVCARRLLAVDYGERRAPWRRQRAVQPDGVTATAIHWPQPEQ